MNGRQFLIAVLIAMIAVGAVTSCINKNRPGGPLVCDPGYHPEGGICRK